MSKADQISSFDLKNLKLQLMLSVFLFVMLYFTLDELIFHKDDFCCVRCLLGDY